MEMTKQDRLTKLLNAYSHHYDIERDVDVEGRALPRHGVLLSAR